MTVFANFDELELLTPGSAASGIEHASCQAGGTIELLAIGGSLALLSLVGGPVGDLTVFPAVVGDRGSAEHVHTLAATAATEGGNLDTEC